ncbi:hypothetical protein RFI_05404, partial [Reticulomyxa filosa]
VTPFFSLSWILTWFSHNIERFEDIARLYDFFLASHPLMPVYFTVAMIVDFREKLLNECECSPGGVHIFFQHIKWNDWRKERFDKVIEDSAQMFQRFPPRQLYTEFAFEELKQIPDDSPFLAQNIDEVVDLNKQYSGIYLRLPFWHYQNPDFWNYIALPLAAAALAGYCISTWNTKK